MRQSCRLCFRAILVGGGLLHAIPADAQPNPSPVPELAISGPEDLPAPLPGGDSEALGSRSTPFPTALGGFGGGFGGLRGLGTVGGLGGGGLFDVRANFSLLWMPDQPVANQPTNLGFIRQEFSLSAPAWRNETDSVSMSAHVRSTNYSTSAILPDSGQAFPESLYNIGFGLNYIHMFDGWTAGGMLNFGSASDRPFNSIRELNLGIGGFVRIPTSATSGWMLGAMYSATGELPFPIPIVAYSWQPSEQFGMNIGLPFSIRWRPIDDWLFDVAYVPVRTIHARATYRVSEDIGLYGGFDWSNDAYLLANRADDKDRLFYYEKTLSLGVRYDFGSTIAVDLSGGYAFDRLYFNGQQWSDNQHDRIDVGNSLFLAFRFQLRY
jgi:hypothetical protein